MFGLIWILKLCEILDGVVSVKDDMDNLFLDSIIFLPSTFRKPQLVRLLLSENFANFILQIDEELPGMFGLIWMLTIVWNFGRRGKCERWHFLIFWTFSCITCLFYKLMKSYQACSDLSEYISQTFYNFENFVKFWTAW